MNKIGIVLPYLYTSDLAFQVLSQTSNKYDFSVFYEETSMPVVYPSCGIFSANEIFNYDGVLIGTTISNALSVAKTLKPTRKYFYIWDLEWLRSYKNYFYNLSAYQNPKLTLITPSEDYRKEIKNYANRDSIVMPLDLEMIYELE